MTGNAIGKESRRFFYFGIIGGVGTLINTAMLYLLTSYTSMHYLLASVIATETAIVSNFLGNNFLTFRKIGTDSSLLKKFRTYQAISLITVLGTLFILWALSTAFGEERLILWNMVAIASMFGMNFLLNRKFTWNQEYDVMQDAATLGAMEIRTQGRSQWFFYAAFGIVTVILLFYYFSNTIIHFTTPQQFPINSFKRFPLSILIFPVELFSLSFALYFVYTLFSDQNRNPDPEPLANRDKTTVAVLLPIYNEPKDIVERTISAVKALSWKGGIKIYILDDSGKGEYTDTIDRIAETYGCSFITIDDNKKSRKETSCSLVRRNDRIGYKAGNINNAIKNFVKEDFFMILDSDQAPLSLFLEETMDYFSDPNVGFVQTPQYFINEDTPLERAAKIGTNIFFHAQSVSKAHDGAMPFCGTNVVVRTQAFREVNGFSYYTSTEDIDLGIRMNAAGYRGAYVPKILAKGYSPSDFKSYSSQQYRWANGNLAILREHWARILFGGFSLKYQIHTLFTLGWWFIGIATFIYILVPLISLYIGAATHHTWLPEGLIILLYLNVVLGIGMIYFSLQKRLLKEPVKISDALLEYSLVTNSLFIYMSAAVNAMLKRYVGFVRTSKARSATGLGLIKLNLILSLVCFGSSIYALYNVARASSIEQVRTFLPVSLWLLFYSLVLASSVIFVGGYRSAERG